MVKIGLIHSKHTQHIKSIDPKECRVALTSREDVERRMGEPDVANHVAGDQ